MTLSELYVRNVRNRPKCPNWALGGASETSESPLGLGRSDGQPDASGFGRLRELKAITAARTPRA